MSGVKVLVGTRKGALVLTADGKRDKWEVSGPHFAGWEMYHVKGSPVDANRLYASQSSGWFGQQIQRSDDGGQRWTPVDNQFVYDGVAGTHQWYDGKPHHWQPGAGGLCLHTIILDPSNERRMFIAISAAGAFRGKVKEA